MGNCLCPQKRASVAPTAHRGRTKTFFFFRSQEMAMSRAAAFGRTGSPLGCLEEKVFLADNFFFPLKLDLPVATAHWHVPRKKLSRRKHIFLAPAAKRSLAERSADGGFFFFLTGLSRRPPPITLASRTHSVRGKSRQFVNSPCLCWQARNVGYELMM